MREIIDSVFFNIYSWYNKMKTDGRNVKSSKFNLIDIRTMYRRLVFFDYIYLFSIYNSQTFNTKPMYLRIDFHNPYFNQCNK